MNTEMSQQVNPLLSKELWPIVRSTPMPRLSEQVLLRLREEMARLDMSQRDVAGILGWSQSRVAHILNRRVEMSVDDLAEFSQAVSLAPTEVVRDHGLEFCAEMTPSELRLLERIRQLDQTTRDAVIQLLDARTKTRMQERRALPAKAVRKRSG